MILTEEQRAALKRVVAYMDEMYAIASPYYGCTEDANILRAMIDGSEHFTGASKMIGFDLEKARAADEALPYPLDAKEIWISRKGQMHINLPNAPSIFFTLSDLCEFRNIFHGQAAEIERLREALDKSEQILAHKTKTSTHWYEEGLQTRADLVQCKRVVEQQAARIKALESLVESSMSLVGCHQRVIEKREKALVEERARCIELGRAASTGRFKPVPPLQESKELARRQLQRDGKIGPDADAKPQVWQITEERKAAIDRGMRFLAWSNAKTNDPGTEIDLAVLRAMLTEAGQ